MGSTITARLVDMESAISLYDSIYADLELVFKALNSVTTTSNDVWNGDAASVFKTNMNTLLKQVQTVSSSLFACRTALAATINAYSALEDKNISATTAASAGFATPAY